MTCEGMDSLLDDYVDGALDAPARQSVDAHLAGCVACRGVVDATRGIRETAARLERHAPPPQLWGRIAAAVEEDARWPWWQQALAGLFGGPIISRQFIAACIVVALIAGIGTIAWFDLRPDTGSNPATVATTLAVSDDVPPLVRASVAQAEAELRRAIANLEAIRQTEGTQLDPITADVVQTNIEVVDQAIEQSRAALQTDPDNEIAEQSFLEALQSKMALLQTAIALINEMRQGDQAGAAAIMSGQTP